MKSISDQILGGEAFEAVEQPSTLSDVILSTPTKETPKAVEEFNLKNMAKANREGFVKGLSNVLNTVGQGIGYVDSFFPGGEERSKKFNERVSKENKEFNEKYPEGDGLLPTGPRSHEMLGEIAATAPLTPMRAFQAVKGAMGALPTVTATGEKIAAPFLNRAAASAVTGGAAGAEYGALTSAKNDKSLLENTTEGLILGAAAGPILTTAAAAGKGVLPTIKSMWANININKLAQSSNLEPSAVKKIVTYLEDAGFTPQQAQAELNRLGPDATLGDLSSSLQARVGGLATINGKAMEVVKGRYEARGKTANSEAHQLMERNLGPKPNLDSERETILKDVRKAVKPDYDAAYTSGDVLDVKPIVDKIDKNLESAVGPKAQALKRIKGYMFNRTKDPVTGEEVSTLKNSISHLHEVREAIDDVVDKAQNPTTSIGKRALRAVSDIRNEVDALLKSNSQMAAADAKFADKMQILKDIDAGENLLKNNGMNIQEFAKFYDALPPDRQAAIAKGLHGHIGDLMEQSSRGELSEAQRLFGKNSRNRTNLEKVFGNRGAEVLDALEKQATFRGTERSILARSHTAEGQSVQREFGERNDGGGVRDIAQGMIIDTLSGAPGAATAIMATKRAGSHINLNISTGRKDRLIEGTADLLSRQGAERDTGLGIAARVRDIQERIKPKRNFSLPPKSATYLFSAPAGQVGYSEYKKLGQE